MARPSKLTATQCAKAIKLHDENPKRWSASKLAKRFGVSESSMYKVFDGSYKAGADPQPIQEVAPLRPHGVTPSIFQQRATSKVLTDLEELEEIDDLTLAAAQLIVARSRFARALHSH